MAAQVEYLPDGSAAVSFTYRRQVVDLLKTHIPADCRAYDPDLKIWYVAAPWCNVAKDILMNAFGDVDVSNHRPSPASPIRQLDPVFAELHLLPSAPPYVVRAVYREMAKAHHPDRGGATVNMQRVNLAFEQLKARGAA
jgi:hypothetical protein